MSDYKQGRGLRAGCSGGWEEGVSQVKSVRELLLQEPTTRTENILRLCRGGMDKVRDRRESKLLASHSAP